MSNDNISYIETDISNLLDFRRKKNLELYSKTISSKKRTLYVHAQDGIILTSDILIGSDEWQSIEPFVNKPITMFDKRLISHDWGNNTTWDSTSNSIWQVVPPEGYKYVITHIQLRFPTNTKVIPANSFKYEVYISPDGITPIDGTTSPIINLEYESTLSLIKRANTSVNITTDTIPEAFNDKLAEVTFKYCNPATLEGSPIVLRSSLNERIDSLLTNNMPILSTTDTALTTEFWAIVNCKILPDF